MTRRRLWPLLAIWAALTAPAIAEVPRDHAACLAQARQAPESGYRAAQNWSQQGGGAMARHCAALALLYLGQSSEAAARLESLATEAKNPGQAAAWLAQAGQAWFMARRFTRAETVQSQVLQRAPDNIEFRIDRAVTRLSAGDHWAALDDLNQVLERYPGHIDAYLFRAAAYRYLDALDLARDDVERLLALDPARAEGWLERGILRQLQGDLRGARDDLMRAIAKAEDPAVVDAARRRLEMVDVTGR